MTKNNPGSFCSRLCMLVLSMMAVLLVSIYIGQSMFFEHTSNPGIGFLQGSLAFLYTLFLFILMVLIITPSRLMWFLVTFLCLVSSNFHLGLVNVMMYGLDGVRDVWIAAVLVINVAVIFTAYQIYVEISKKYY